ncbi:unnamed protein product [Orchesella dallaii]|uniref:Odorant receptor n=1 Tax=Orchesella dallaii TaxID=48710 RepID=A0ABP1RJP5_9HEXA
MGFGVAFINVQLLHQRIFESPILYDTTTGQVVANPKAKNPFNIPIWHLVKAFVFAIHLFSIYRCVHIVEDYKSFNVINPENTFLYVFVTAITTQALVTIYTIERDPASVASTITKHLTVAGITNEGWPNSERLPDIKEICAYILASGFFNFPIITALYPLKRSLDPVNLLLENVVPEILRRILACLIYGVFVCVAANICAALILIVLTCLEIIQTETEKNYLLSMEKPVIIRMPRIELIINRQLKTAFLWLEKKFEWFRPGTQSQRSHWNRGNTPNETNWSTQHKFKRSFKKHMINTLLIDAGNETVNVFIPTQMTVGMALCISIICIIIKLHGNEYLRPFLYISLLVLVGIIGHTFVLFKQASLPLIYTTETIRFWKGKHTGPLFRRQLRCMRSVGYKIGKFFYCKRATALEVIEKIIDATITILVT